MVIMNKCIYIYIYIYICVCVCILCCAWLVIISVDTDLPLNCGIYSASHSSVIVTGTLGLWT